MLHERVVNGHFHILGRHGRRHETGRLPFARLGQPALARCGAHRVQHERDGCIALLFLAHIIAEGRRLGSFHRRLSVRQLVGYVLASRLSPGKRDHRRPNLVFLSHGYSSSDFISRSLRVSRSEQCSHIRHSTP